ncbi:MAG: nucleotidyltransferase family protein [Bryobacterales bacterium]|nr:nucleotidyltransferase family protein [Bryobacterales bacterium]
MSIAGIILAAGGSRRMGTPKPLLELNGETFLDRLILTLGATCAPVIVVLGCGAPAIRAGLRHADLATILVNPDYSRGQLSSLQCGMEAIPPSAEGVMFTPVDQPAVRPSTVAHLARAFQRRAPEQLLVVPRCQGRHGHPVCAARELISEFLALPPESQAREVVRRHRDHTLYLDVDDAGTILDVDDPESYQRLRNAES